MMHAHEIAEIAEIQEVARRALGEASLVPKAQVSEDTSPRQEQEEVDDIATTYGAEGMITPEESAENKLESVETLSEVEGVDEVEELTPSATTSPTRDGELEEREGEELEAASLVSESEVPPGEEGEVEESEVEPGSGALESEAAERFSVEFPELGVDRVDARQEESASDDVEEPGVWVTQVISEVDEVPFIEGLVGTKNELEFEEEESVQDESRETEETPSGEVSEAQEIAELEDRDEAPRESVDEQQTEWKRPEALDRESAEEVSAPLELSVEGGVERPASPVRIITFREGGTEIGICPYCGRFVRGSDLARHKLKHRVRSALGLQTGD
jgi:hypothetical protein